MIDAFQTGDGKLEPANTATQAALDAANATLEAQAAQLANLERDLADAELRLGSGEYNTKIWRCVEFADSPAARDHAIRKETLEKLRGENGALVERIKELEGRVGGGPVGHGMVPRETYDRLKEEFKEKERGHEKRLLRLKEVSNPRQIKNRTDVPADLWNEIQGIPRSSLLTARLAYQIRRKRSRRPPIVNVCPAQ